MRIKKYTLASTRKFKGKIKLIKYYQRYYNEYNQHIFKAFFEKYSYDEIIRKIKRSNIEYRNMITIHEDHFNAKIFMIIRPSCYFKSGFNVISFMDQYGAIYASFILKPNDEIILLKQSIKLKNIECLYLEYIVRANTMVLNAINEMEEEDAEELLKGSSSYFLDNARRLLLHDNPSFEDIKDNCIRDIEENFTKIYDIYN